MSDEIKPVVRPEDRAVAFWDKAEKGDGCWIWRGKLNPRHGYGQFYVGWDGHRYAEWRAHRLAWYLTNGEIPPLHDVCHRCDNPLCVRPDHLFLGDRKANMRDAASKRRLHWQKTADLAAKIEGLFTWADVDRLRNAANALHANPSFGLIATPTELFRLADRIAALLPPRP